MDNDELIGLFPTPLMVCRDLLPAKLVKGLIDHLDKTSTTANVRTTLLTHTPMADPRANEAFMDVRKCVMPKLSQFGETLMGERLDWAIKEIWVNRMEQGGAQKMHNHANSFISGVCYLTEIDASAATVFHRPTSPTSFVMANENAKCTIGPFNAPIFKAPAMRPGDVVLFPSYILHEVPPNQGALRYTAAFNALPERIDSWGYTIRFK